MISLCIGLTFDFEEDNKFDKNEFKLLSRLIRANLQLRNPCVWIT